MTYSAESKAKIDDAKDAYNALAAAQKALVTNYATLTAAETDYANLAAAAADRVAAEAVEAKIDAIGEVVYTNACKAKIDTARAAHNALTAAQQALVGNYETLTAATATVPPADRICVRPSAAPTAVRFTPASSAA